MNIDKYQSDTLRFAVYPLNKGYNYYALGLAGEVGEVCNKIKKVWRKSCKLKDVKGDIKDELGDVAWYFVRLCDRLGLKASDVLKDNIKKIKCKRKSKS